MLIIPIIELFLSGGAKIDQVTQHDCTLLHLLNKVIIMKNTLTFLLVSFLCFCGCNWIEDNPSEELDSNERILRIYVSEDGIERVAKNEFTISSDGGTLKLVAFYLDNPEKKRLDDQVQIGSSASEGHFTVTREKNSDMETYFVVTAKKNSTGQRQALGIELLDTTGFAPYHYGFARVVISQLP